MTDDPAATSWTRGETAAFDMPEGPYRADGTPPFDPVPPQSEGVPGSAGLRRSPVLGVFALAFAFAAIVVEVVAISVASSGDYVLGTTLAVVVIALAVIAVLTGVIAVILKRGRLLGLAGAVIGLLANPLVLVAVLRLVDGTPSLD